MAMQRQASLYRLPQPLIDGILSSLAPSLEDIAQLRLVAKSWRAAIQHYPGSAKLKSLDKLEDLCSLMPNIASVTLKNINSPFVNLSLLGQSPQLTSLSLAAMAVGPNPGHKKPAPVEVDFLPGSLKDLHLKNLGLAPGSFDHTAASITSLCYRHTLTFSYIWEWRWLHHLQDLQVITIETRIPAVDTFNTTLGKALERLPNLTFLSIISAKKQLKAPVKRVQCSLKLPNLRLRNFKLSRAWQGSALGSLPALTSLELFKCSMERHIGILQPCLMFSSLRRLKLWEYSCELLPMAGPELQSLEIDLKWTTGILLTRETRLMGQLTSLTRLEMHAYAFSSIHPDGPRQTMAYSSVNLAALRALPLRELVLLNCQNLEIGLFEHGALKSLQKLHILDSQKRQAVVAEQPAVVSQLVSCARTVLSLPQLTQLSGSCALFSLAMGSELSTWQQIKYRQGLVTTNNVGGVSGLRVWLKPNVWEDDCRGDFKRLRS